MLTTEPRNRAERRAQRDRNPRLWTGEYDRHGDPWWWRATAPRPWTVRRARRAANRRARASRKANR